MPETIWAVIITASASIICQLIIASKSKALLEYRIDQLEEKVTAFNHFNERMIIVEERSKSNTHRIDELEKKN